MNTPERLNLWDRLFNRYRKEVADRGQSLWQTTHTYGGVVIGEPSEYYRNWVEYRIIDRLTGSETIKREYLN